MPQRCFSALLLCGLLPLAACGEPDVGEQLQLDAPRAGDIVIDEADRQALSAA